MARWFLCLAQELILLRKIYLNSNIEEIMSLNATLKALKMENNKVRSLDLYPRLPKTPSTWSKEKPIGRGAKDLIDSK